jgi:hypothetical protein
MRKIVVAMAVSVLIVTLHDRLWEFIRVHVQHACVARLEKLTPAEDTSYITVELNGTEAQLKCAADVIDRERSLNRYEARLKEWGR